MTSLLAALAPVFLIIVLGAALRRGGFPGEAFWPAAARTSYFLLLPALLLSSLAGASLAEFRVLPLAAALIGSVLVVTLALGLLRPRLGADGPVFTSLAQGSIRGNAFIGLASAQALFGGAGLAVAAIVIAVLVPTVNVVSVALLGRYAGPAPLSARELPALLARNPLILACLLGVALNLTGIGLPWGLDGAVGLMGKAALPVGLLTVGAALDLAAARAQRPVIALSCLLKLIAFPLLVAVACAAFGVGGLTAAVAILFAALPGAPASYILARQLGGDAPLMAGIITVQVIAAAATMPAMLALLL